MAFCTNCGEKLLGNALFCTNCGAPVGGKTPVSEPIEKKAEEQPEDSFGGEMPDMEAAVLESAEVFGPDREAQTEPVTEVPEAETTNPSEIVPEKLSETETANPSGIVTEKSSETEMKNPSEVITGKLPETGTEVPWETATEKSVQKPAEDTYVRQERPADIEAAPEPRQTHTAPRREPVHTIPEPVIPDPARNLTDQPFEPAYAPLSPAVEPITTGGFVGIFLLLSVPVLNLILLIIWACGGCRKVNKRNFARAVLIILLVGLIVAAVIVGVAFLVLGPDRIFDLIYQISSGIAQVFK